LTHSLPGVGDDHRKEDIPALALYLIGQKSRYLKLNFDAVLPPGGAAELLRIHSNTLRKRMKKLNIVFGRMRK
jgi:transcriptional regulator with PAS, ATPase and Fis domain